MGKLAIIATHPIQYHAPWFRYLANQDGLEIKVFYLWNFGVTNQLDSGFQQAIEWDIPLLTGYDYEFVPNTSAKTGTTHFWGLQNPLLLNQVEVFAPDAVLLTAYNYASLYSFIWHWDRQRAPLLFRGDSHRLVVARGVKEWTKRKAISAIFRRFDAFLYVGQANLDYFKYHEVPGDKLFFAPHAVDNERFIANTLQASRQALTWKQELGIPSDHSVIMFAGKFEPKKRPFDLLQAFVRADLPACTLLFVGAGEMENELRSRASKCSNIRFAPFQNQSLMPRTYLAADIFVLPSYGPHETWGLAINEAMCMGCPVIVSTHVGCAKDLVRPYRNGLVFPAGDVTALSSSLKEALADRDRLRKWGEESRRIISHYSYHHTTEGLKEALAQLGVMSVESGTSVPANREETTVGPQIQ
jgi:glycosyltransferase involved in cell wall biosynthesis